MLDADVTYTLGYPVPGQTTVYDKSQTIDLDTVLLDGGVLVKTLYLSVDPYLRFRMRDPKEEKKFVSRSLFTGRFHRSSSVELPQSLFTIGQP